MDNRNTFFNKPQPPQPQTTATEVAIAPESEALPSVKIERSFAAAETVEMPQTATVNVPTSPTVNVQTAPPLSASSFSLKNMLSQLVAHPNILPLLVVAVVFFMGNQFGLGCQKQREIRQQIREIEGEHKKTLELMKDLQKKSADQEAAVLKQVNDFYATLQQLDLKSEVVKTALQKAKIVIDNGKKQAIEATIQHNTEVEARINTIDERLKYFDMKDRDSTTNQ